MRAVQREFREIYAALERIGFTFHDTAHGFIPVAPNGIKLFSAVIPKRHSGSTYSRTQADQVIRKVMRAFPEGTRFGDMLRRELAGGSPAHGPAPIVRAGEPLYQDDRETPMRSTRTAKDEGILQVRTKRPYSPMPHSAPIEAPLYVKHVGEDGEEVLDDILVNGRSMLKREQVRESLAALLESGRSCGEIARYGLSSVGDLLPEGQSREWKSIESRIRQLHLRGQGGDDFVEWLGLVLEGINAGSPEVPEGPTVVARAAAVTEGHDRIAEILFAKLDAEDDPDRIRELIAIIEERMGR